MGKVGNIEKEKRIYQISLLLRRKPMSFIIQYISQNWNLTTRQAYNYIELARKEWQKYFANIKSSGIGYHITQMRDLKDAAYKENDYRLVLDITKEEAKLMGIYPADKHKVELEGDIVINITGREEDDNDN